MTNVDLAEIMGRRTRKRTSKPTPAQKEELKRRRTVAANLARQAILDLHRDEYQSLYKQALEMVNAERGPLPD